MALFINAQSNEADFISSVLETLGCVNAEQLKFLFSRLSGGLEKHSDIRPVLSYMVQSKQIKFYGQNSDVIIPFFSKRGDNRQILCNWVAMDMFYNKDRDIFDVSFFRENVSCGEAPIYLSYVLSDVLYNLSYVDVANISKLLLVQERYDAKCIRIKEEYRDNFRESNCNVFVSSNPEIKKEIAKIGITIPHKIAIVDVKGRQGCGLPKIQYFTKK